VGKDRPTELLLGGAVVAAPFASLQRKSSEPVCLVLAVVGEEHQAVQGGFGSRRMGSEG